MNTRSQAKRPILPIDIDFDEASEAWRQNKKSLPNGMYKYICTYVKEDDTNICGKVCYQSGQFCWVHRKKNDTDDK